MEHPERRKDGKKQDYIIYKVITSNPRTVHEEDFSRVNNARIDPREGQTCHLLKGLGRAIKQLLDEVFVISRIIKVEVRVISRSRRLRLITLTSTLIILDITKTESNNCFIIH